MKKRYFFKVQKNNDEEWVVVSRVAESKQEAEKTILSSFRDLKSVEFLYTR